MTIKNSSSSSSSIAINDIIYENAIYLLNYTIEHSIRYKPLAEKILTSLQQVQIDQVINKFI